MTEDKRGDRWAMSALVALKTEGEALAEHGADIARSNVFGAEMDLIGAHNKLLTMRTKNLVLNDKVNKLTAEISELRALLEKRNEILVKIRAGIKAKIMSSDAIATVMVNYGKKAGMTSDEIKSDVASASKMVDAVSGSYSKKADDKLVLAGADEEVMAAVNAAVGLAVEPRKAPQGT